jgi:lipoate-protein ligase B
VDYTRAWERQKAYVEERIAGLRPDTFVFCVHQPVITLGRASQRDLATSGVLAGNTPVPVLNIERGGQATYHGPGQLVVYPIVKLGRGADHPSRTGVVSLIRSMEAWLCEALGEFQVPAQSVEGKTGVWVQGGTRKIASIGIAARHWVSYHGLAINLDVGPEPWQWISPCGMTADVMTDLKVVSGRRVLEREFAECLLKNAERHFGSKLGALMDQDCNASQK